MTSLPIADVPADGGESCAGAKRGVLWVLQWAAALGSIAFSLGLLAEFGYVLAAERTLARAARAGALEATLPRASYESVCQSVWRRVQHSVGDPALVRVRLVQNGRAPSRPLRMRPDDVVQVAVSMPRSHALPRWLRRLGRGREEAWIVVRVEGSGLRVKG